MKRRKLISCCAFITMLVCITSLSFSQQRGIKSITEDELRLHLTFIASDEFGGRNTPSTELKAAARYLATIVESCGFKPLMPDGSFLQNIPLEITKISEAKTELKIYTDLGEHIFYFPQAFGLSSSAIGRFSGEIVFVGRGIYAPDLGWDDFGDIDLTGKVVVMLQAELPREHELMKPENRRIVQRSSLQPRSKGATGVLSIVSEEQEKKCAESGMYFDNPERGRVFDDIESRRRSSQMTPFVQAEIRHDVATALLGVSKDVLREMFAQLSRGEQVPGKEYPGKIVEINVETEKYKGNTQNVVAILEGSDEQLKNEYVLFGSHYDHVGTRNGEVYNGADDDGSGTVSMLEIAQAMSIERPKRSVVMVWHTGEEKGLWGSRYFTRFSPIPIEKISAQLQMDMISRNAPDSIYVIGTHFLSSEPDQLSIDVARNLHVVHLNNLYNDPNLRRNFFHQSDHYPYYQVGIPVIFYFCGVHEDLHRPTDTVDKCDFDKMKRITQLVYAVGFEIGNRDSLMKLDRDPNITSRGLHNLKSNK